MNERVLVAMSGGVDSSVAAARLLDAGHDVVGVTLHLWESPDDGAPSRCCAPEDVRDARRVADQLGFPHYALDRRELFTRMIVDPFVDAYLEGKTPSPCATCNRTIKLPALLRLARLMDARWVATGHYARIVTSVSGPLRVARGTDPDKDQSYFLYALDQDSLQRLLLPLGTDSKASVRAEALSRGLVGAAKGESQDLCFVSEGGYIPFIEQRAQGRMTPGWILDRDGKRLARHEGVHRFTLGQRKGLGVATGQPVFVSDIDATSGDVTVDAAASTCIAEVFVDQPSICPGLQLPAQAVVQVRYRHAGARATLTWSETSLRITFDAPVRAASIGQVAVAYDHDAIVAGGTITRVVRAPIARPMSEVAT